MIRFQCSNCGKKLKAAEESAGRRVKCLGCQAIARVPDDPPGSGGNADSNANSTRPESEKAGSEKAGANPAAIGKATDPKVKQAEPVGHMFGQSTLAAASGQVVDREFKSKAKPTKSGRWWLIGVGVALVLIVASVIGYVVVKRAYAIPKFKAEFEAMAEVEFYRRAHGQLEQSRRRMSVMAGAFKAKSSPAGDFSEQHQRLNASIDSYTDNSETLLTEAAMLLAQGKDLHAKSLLVETGKKMQALIKDIEQEVGQFNKKANR